VWLTAAAHVVEGINPGGFPNSVTAPIRGWYSWNVRTTI
jgi:hypothetical protein